MGGKSSSANRTSSTATATASSSSSSASGSASVDHFNCDYCGAHARDGRRDDDGHSCCGRCGALLRSMNAKKGSKKKAETKEYSAMDEKDEDIALPIKRMNLVPYRETLPEDAKTELSETVMVDTYLKPFFATGKHFVQMGMRFQIREVDFKVVSVHPPAGIVNDATKIRCMDQPLSALAHVAKLHVIPSASSIAAALGPEAKLDHTQLFSEYVKPYFASQSRHVAQGDTFMSKGIQFKVIGAAPTNGVVDRSTEIYTDGTWLQDIKKVHILPIFESLPNREKTITATQSFERYLEPFFAGRHQLIRQGEELQIDGVSFKVVAAEPAEGLVTASTLMFADGEPIRADDIKTAQLEADEELARQLQRQEAVSGVYSPRGGGGGGGGNGPAGGGVPVPDELRARLQDILRMMPANDRNRPLVQRLHDQLAMLPFVPSGTPYDRNLLVLLQAVNQMSAGAAAQPVNHGASQRDIDSLPTRKYVASGSKTEVKERDKEHISCIVCMADYEANEELRTLPCFHSYHKECIDKWLAENKKCPICKNPIC